MLRDFKYPMLRVKPDASSYIVRLFLISNFSLDILNFLTFFIRLKVYGLWRLPVLRPVMKKYFCANPAAPNNCWPMLLSAFSHYRCFTFND